MGRPAEVSDDEVIAAGLKVQQTLPSGGRVTATALWSACGRRGRPDRLLAVWRNHESGCPTAIPAASALPLTLPEPAREKLAGCIVTLTHSLEQTAASIYREIEETFASRYHSELEALSAARAEIQNEREEALEALGDAGERLTELEARIAELEEALAASANRESIQAELRRQEKKMQTQAAARIEQLGVRQLELERELAASDAREHQACERADKLSAELAAAHSLLQDQRAGLNEAKGRLQAQEERIRELRHGLETERTERLDLAAKLHRGVQVLAGEPGTATDRPDGASPPTGRTRTPKKRATQSERIGSAAAMDGLTTTRALADAARADADFVAVAELYAPRATANLDALVADLVDRESVPFLAVLRYAETGLRKRADWEATWEKQRAEDRIDAEAAGDRDLYLQEAWAKRTGRAWPGAEGPLSDAPTGKQP